MSNRAFIYGLADPETGIVRYVGKANDPATRLASHLRDKASTRKARWLRSLDVPPQVLILEEAPQESWQEAERWWIAYFRRQGTDLTNHTEGGEGLVGATPDTRAKISRAAKKRMEDPDFRARVFTPERAKRISEALTGLPKSVEHVAKLPQNQAGRTLSPEHADRAREILREHGWHWPKGVPRSPETKAKIAMALLGNQHTKGRVIPLDERRKRSQTTLGRPKPQETRERISTALTEAWASGRRVHVPAPRIDWPAWAEVEAALAVETIGEVALRLGVKRGTLSAYIARRRRGAPEQGRAA